MSQHQILDPKTHADLRIRAEAGGELGDGVSAALAVPAEFRRLACEFPLLFRRDGASGAWTALALLGFEPGENLFLAGTRWDAVCRPLSLAVQPFLIGRAADGAGPSQVHIDMAHPRIAADGEGIRVFDADGTPSPFLEEAIEMLGLLDNGYQASADFFAAVDRYDLLEPFSMDVTLDSGAAHRMVGYNMVNEEALAGLEPGILAELHAAGHLAPLYFAVASLGNLGKLVRRKNRKGHG
ncbi:SapC family protein [Novosphingobium sp.]|uniref:SapC family protein n=1 Tax=Novosphingobium sp. TaxID=1874826 RepID=UPI00286B1D0C|nr:SapC family protein [Novosphingobium sp.]